MTTAHTKKVFVAPFDLEQDPELIQCLADVDHLLDLTTEHLVSVCLEQAQMHRQPKVDFLVGQAHALTQDRLTQIEMVNPNYELLVSLVYQTLIRLSFFVFPIAHLVQDQGLWGRVRIIQGDIYLEHHHEQPHWRYPTATELTDLRRSITPIPDVSHQTVPGHSSN